MKQITCEMCGSTALTKQDGVFVCQSCGCKYSVEEAKKMLVEGHVDVSGSTVKMDTSEELANLYQIARRAKGDNNAELAAKYYDMILVKDPTSWEASFYVVYFKAMECKIADIASAANSVKNCEYSVLKLIRDYVQEDKQVAAVNDIVCSSQTIASMLAHAAHMHFNGISSDIKENYDSEYRCNVRAAEDIMYECGNLIERLWGADVRICKLAADAWKAGNKLQTQFPSVWNDNNVKSYAEKIEKYELEYTLGREGAELELKKRERKKLINELNQLKNELSTAEKRKGASPSSFRIGGIVFAIVGALEIWAFSLLLDGLFSFCFKMVGFLSICAGIYLFVRAGKLAKSDAESLKSHSSYLKSQIETTQAELDALNKWFFQRPKY